MKGAKDTWNMAYKKATIELARRYYVVEGKTISQISQVIGVPETTIYKWQRREQWDKDVADAGNVSLWLNMQKQFAQAVKTAIDENKLTDPSTADSLWKTAKLMDRLMPEKVMLSNIFNFLEDITRFFATVAGDTEFLERFQDLLPDLADHLRQKYTTE
jgi:transposase-like protein